VAWLRWRRCSSCSPASSVPRVGPLLLRVGRRRASGGAWLSYGINAHAIGTARALEEGDECGAFAALGMSLLGILIALLLPFALG